MLNFIPAARKMSSKEQISIQSSLEFGKSLNNHTETSLAFDVHSTPCFGYLERVSHPRRSPTYYNSSSIEKEILLNEVGLKDSPHNDLKDSKRCVESRMAKSSHKLLFGVKVNNFEGLYYNWILCRGFTATVCYCKWNLPIKLYELPKCINFLSSAFFERYILNSFTGENISKALNVVVKVIHKSRLSSATELERSRDESAISSSLHHENILPILLSGEDACDIYLMYEYSSLGDLYTICKNKSFEEHVVRNILTQVLKALCYIHECNIVHCDIKPHNLLVYYKDPPHNEYDGFHSESESNTMHSAGIEALRTGNFRIKLCDFGLAQIQSHDKWFTCEDLRGSHGYLAPELLRRNQYNEKIDMWAVGIIGFTLLGGYDPFYPASDCLKSEVVFDDTCWKGVSDSAHDFIRSLLSTDVDKRLSAAKALQHPWITSQKTI